MKDENFHLRNEGKKSCAYCADLIAKEQECERLKGDLYFTNEQLKDFKSHYDKVVEECENLREKYLGLKEQKGSYIVQLNTVNEQLDQLKIENQALKDEFEILQNNFDSNNREWEEHTEVLLQAFTEIKKIADDWIYTEVADELAQVILQKISEVIDE